MRQGLWTAPIALAALSLIGLLSALLGDEIWDAVSWAALAVPLCVIAWFGLRTTKRAS